MTSRGSRRSSSGTREFVQRPARRNGREQSRFEGFSARALLGYVPSALKGVLGILALIAAFIGYRAAASAAIFQVKSVDVVGTSRTSSEEIEALTRRAVARTGVWRADLGALSAELGRLPGVRRAVVSRVLPDRLSVRVTERVPLAVMHSANGRLVWVDEEGVALGEMKPTDRVPSFFIRGWNEDGTEDARKENVERVQKYLEAVREWEVAGLAERVSEVNLTDVRDVRAQLAGNDSQIEVRLGGSEPGQRLKLALSVLDEYRQTPRGASITYIAFQGNKIVVGSSSGERISNTAEPQASGADQRTAAPSQPKALPTKPETSGKQAGSKDSTSAKKRGAEARESKAANRAAMRLR